MFDARNLLHSLKAILTVIHHLDWESELSLSLTNKRFYYAITSIRHHTSGHKIVFDSITDGSHFPIYTHTNIIIMPSKSKQTISQETIQYMENHYINHNINYHIKYLNEIVGYGVVSDCVISKNTFLFIYAGEMISSVDTLLREKLHKTNKVITCIVVIIPLYIF